MNCKHCSEEFNPNPRVKYQEYCGKEECQRVRRRSWQKEKLKNDSDYKKNQRESWKKWYEAHPDYFRKYKNKHLDYINKNRDLQKIRDAKRSCKNGLDKNLVKMDSLNHSIIEEEQLLQIIFPAKYLVKMDSLNLSITGEKQIL